MQTHAKPATIDGYRRMWSLYIEPRFGGWPLGDLRTTDVGTWVAELAGRRSPATTRKAHRVLSLVLGHAITSGRLASNPANGVKLPRLIERTPVAADATTIEALAAATRPPAGEIVRLLAYTGLRWGEATALQCGDVDLRRKRLHVRRTHVELSGRLTTGTPKSNRTRQVPIVRPLIPLLEGLTSDRGSADLVFTTANGLPWRSSNFRRDGGWAAATRAVGLNGFRVHDLRHTAASLMIASGASVVDVASVLGHASSHTTLTVYAHMIGGRLDDVSDRLASVIESGCGQNVATNPLTTNFSGTQTRGKSL